MNLEGIGNWINSQSKTHTTSQVMNLLKRKGLSDNDIRQSLEYCTKGNAIAMESLLQKVPTKYTHIERVEDINKDVLEQE